MTPWWATIACAAITGFLAVVAQAWAKRGQKAIDLNAMAMKMVDELNTRVKRLEDVEAWRTVVASIDADHISTLRDWIVREQPPPPPPRPIYPPRPQ